MNKTYPDRKALITGAGRGIGAALCQQLLDQSVEVVAMNRSKQPLQSLISELGSPDTISPYYADVTKFEKLEETLALILQQHSDIDLVILNAGLDSPQKIKQFDWRVARAQIDTNLTANYVFVAALVPYLLARGGGRIAIVSSLGSYAGCPYEHAYNASKAGARMMADGLRAELHASPVAITGIYPGFIATEMIEGSAFNIHSAVPLQEAANIIIEGLESGQDEIHFPEQLAELVKQITDMSIEERIDAVRSLVNDSSENL